MRGVPHRYRHLSFVLLLWLCSQHVARSFTTTRRVARPSLTPPPPRCSSPASPVSLKSNKDGNERDDDRLENGIDKGLLPPAINLRRESILFGDDPATRRDSRTLRAWRTAKRVLPYALTGARRTSATADDNPAAGFYNMILVRLPTLVAGLVYAQNAMTGHPLVIDVGFGATEVHPVLVAMAMFLILM